MPLLIALALAAAEPPPQSCQAALGPLYEGTAEEALPGRVDGATIAGAEALVALRGERGDALITIVGGSFAGADFRGARLHNICFLDTDLSRSVWRGTDGAGVGFVRANLEGANLAGARLPAVLLREPNMKDVNAAGADLSGGRLDGGWGGSMENVALDRADLREFEFACGITVSDGCPLERNLSLRSADLAGARLSRWSFTADFRGARLDRTEVAPRQLAELGTARMSGPLLVRGGEATVELAGRDYSAVLAAIRPAETVPGPPSFDCAAARSPVERLICGEDRYSLRVQDRALADLYRRVLAADPSVATSQRAWLAERDLCTDADCVERVYTVRQGQLLGRLGPPAWLRPGARALFVDDPVGFLDSFRATDLYRRLLPAIVGGASSRAVVRVQADGTITVDGDAIGANAHMCSLAGENLRFDPATGWYYGPYLGRPDDPPDGWQRRMPVIRFDGDAAEIYRSGQGGWPGDPVDPRGSDYASCGARAAFGIMIRVPVADAEIERVLGTMEGD